MVIREQTMKIQLTVAEGKQKTDEEKMKTQGNLLDSAQQALSKRERVSSDMISLVVDNAMALMKNHIPDLDTEILRKDFSVNEVVRKPLVNSTYDAAHDFVSLYDFSSLAESDDNNSPRAL
jgi:hypothetical protein